MKGLHTIWCQVTDMDRSVAFYRDVLGLKLEFASPFWSQFDLDGAKIGLHPKLEGFNHPLCEYGRGWFLGLETEDVGALKAVLEQNAVAIHGEYHDVPGGVVLDFQDPDGNTIEAFQSGVTVEQVRS